MMLIPRDGSRLAMRLAQKHWLSTLLLEGYAYASNALLVQRLTAK
jgi:hypothetical protein